MISDYNITDDIFSEYIGFVYVTVNKKNGRSYIGLKHFDKTGIKWDEYLGSGKAIKNAISKYGKDSFYKIIVGFAKTEEELCNLEKTIISINNATNNNNYYNISEGGNGGDTFAGYSDDEFKRYCNSLKGENNPFFGRKHTEESIKKMLEKRCGENHWLYNKHLPEETKKKISAKCKERYKTHRHPSSIEVRIVFNDGEKAFDSIKEAYNYLGLEKKDYQRIRKYDIPKFKKDAKRKSFENILEIYENNKLVYSKKILNDINGVQDEN